MVIILKELEDDGKIILDMYCWWLIVCYWCLVRFFMKEISLEYNW